MDIIKGGLYRLAGAGGWCRHGLVIVEKLGDRLVAVDTYWGGLKSGVFEQNWYEIEKVKDRLEFILNLNEADKVYQDIWEVHEDKDRAYIPAGGGSEIYYVRKGAKPSRQKQIDKLVKEIGDLQSTIRHSQQRIVEKDKELIMLYEQGNEDSNLLSAKSS